jgi:hypothetical protein
MIGGSAAAMAADMPSEIFVPSEIQDGNAAQNASWVTEGLQKVGYTEVQNTTCSGDFCNAQALWEDKPVKLNITIKTGEVEATAQ